MKKEKYLVDTDVLIDYLRGEPKALKFLEDIISNAILYISTITIAELFASVRKDLERQILSDFLKEFHVAEVNQRAAEQGGLYRRDFGKSHSVGLVDAIHAATVEDLDIKLITLNKKHYPMLKDVLVPYHKD